MSSAHDIEPVQSGEYGPVLDLYPKAFPSEDLTDLVAQLLAHPDVINLVARQDGAVIAHAAISQCAIENSTAKVGLLGPLCVDPTAQRQGLGRALIMAGTEAARAAHCVEMLVLGDPKYYGPLGFDRPSVIEAPYPLPVEWCEAWRSMHLAPEGAQTTTRLVPPAPWRNASYWVD